MPKFYKRGMIQVTPQYNSAAWDYWAHFEPVGRGHYGGNEIEQAQEYLKARDIGTHPFFAYAAQKPEALKLWVAQEARITNLFSQTMFALLANTQNVNMRSLLLPVAIGEHSKVEWNGQAERSHPALLAELCSRVGVHLGVRDAKIDGTDYEGMPYPLTPAADRFFQAMTESISSFPYALGFLGVGTEELIHDEYSAIKTSFKSAFGEEFNTDFLDSNINEDDHHAQLMRTAASYLSKHEMAEYLEGAKAGVDARYDYYTSLLNYCLEHDVVSVPQPAPEVK